jgi:hypothetical protein
VGLSGTSEDFMIQRVMKASCNSGLAPSAGFDFWNPAVQGNRALILEMAYAVTVSGCCAMYGLLDLLSR